MTEKRIQLMLNIIAYTALIAYVIWQGIIWWQNPEWSKMQLFQKTWHGLAIAILIALPSVVYEAWRR